MVNLRPHFKMGKPIGPKLMGLSEVLISKDLSDCVESEDLLKALRLGIGVDEYHGLQKGSQISNITKKLLAYS